MVIVVVFVLLFTEQITCFCISLMERMGTYLESCYILLYFKNIIVHGPQF